MLQQITIFRSTAFKRSDSTAATRGDVELATGAKTTLKKPDVSATDKAFYQIKVDYKQPK